METRLIIGILRFTVFVFVMIVHERCLYITISEKVGPETLNCSLEEGDNTRNLH